MLLDDSLHRLKDIKTLQEAKAKPDWDLQAPELKQKRYVPSLTGTDDIREAYYKGQERSSRGFLMLANAILEFLNNILLEVKETFIKSPDMTQKLVSFLIYFFEKMCGPQMSNLKAHLAAGQYSNPTRYKTQKNTGSIHAIF